TNWGGKGKQIIEITEEILIRHLFLHKILKSGLLQCLPCPDILFSDIPFAGYFSFTCIIIQHCAFFVHPSKPIIEIEKGPALRAAVGKVLTKGKNSSPSYLPCQCSGQV